MYVHVMYCIAANFRAGEFSRISNSLKFRGNNFCGYGIFHALMVHTIIINIFVRNFFGIGGRSSKNKKKFTAILYAQV